MAEQKCKRHPLLVSRTTSISPISKKKIQRSTPRRSSYLNSRTSAKTVPSPSCFNPHVLTVMVGFLYLGGRFFRTTKLRCDETTSQESGNLLLFSNGKGKMGKINGDPRNTPQLLANLLDLWEPLKTFGMFVHELTEIVNPTQLGCLIHTTVDHGLLLGTVVRCVPDQLPATPAAGEQIQSVLCRATSCRVQQVATDQCSGSSLAVS